LRQNPEQDKVIFKICPPGLSKSEIWPNTEAASITLKEDTALAIIGGVTSEIVCSGDVILVWNAYAALPAGVDIYLEDIMDFANPCLWDRQ
jgi:hypothetical protein